MTSRRYFGLVFVFASGALVGGCLMAFLSSSASREFLLMAQLSVQAEEDRQALKAWTHGDFGEALGHASCSTSAMYGVAARAFDPELTRWPIGFPFMAPVLARIREPNLKPRGLANAQAASRAKLGVIWEQLGKVDLADREYREAARLAGSGDAKNLRDLGRALLDQSPVSPGNGK